MLHICRNRNHLEIWHLAPLADTKQNGGKMDILLNKLGLFLRLHTFPFNCIGLGISYVYINLCLYVCPCVPKLCVSPSPPPCVFFRPTLVTGTPGHWNTRKPVN